MTAYRIEERLGGGYTYTIVSLTSIHPHVCKPLDVLNHQVTVSKHLKYIKKFL